MELYFEQKTLQHVLYKQLFSVKYTHSVLQSKFPS